MEHQAGTSIGLIYSLVISTFPWMSMKRRVVSPCALPLTALARSRSLSCSVNLAFSLFLSLLSYHHLSLIHSAVLSLPFIPLSLSVHSFSCGIDLGHIGDVSVQNQFVATLFPCLSRALSPLHMTGPEGKSDLCQTTLWNNCIINLYWLNLDWLLILNNVLQSILAYKIS